MPAVPSVAFVLLHGTWAPHARWTKPDSPLCRALRQRFGEHTAIDAVGWKGWNRVGTRAKGALALADHIKKTPVGPDQQRFVIAHSHGGNVALYALRDPEVAARVSGVVTLATPFLLARKRELAKPLQGVLVYLLLPLIVAAAFGLGQLTDQWDRGWRGFGVFALAMIVALVAISLAARWWVRFGDQVFEAMRFGAIAEDRLLIMRSPGDEASVVLLTARAVLSVGMIFFAVFTRIYAAIDRLLVYAAEHRRVAYAMALGGFALSALLLVPLWSLGAGAIGWRLAASFVIVALVALPVPAVLWHEPDFARVYWHWLLASSLLLAEVLPSLLMVFYGWQIAVANVALDVSAEASPLGRWTVTTLTPAKRVGEDGAPTMAHSALYDDPAAIARLCDWVAALAVDPNRAVGTSP